MSEQDDKNRAAEVLERKTTSHRWMEENYHERWVKTYQAYNCEREPEKDEKGRDDDTQTSMHMPDTFSFVRRTVARVTAQPPEINFKAKDSDVAELIGRTLMYQWDKGETQRQQKLHVAQALIFGWSVRAWWWEKNDYVRRKRIDPWTISTNPQTLAAIEKTYGPEIEERFGMPLTPPEENPEAGLPVSAHNEVVAYLMKQYGRGNLLRVAYMATGYEGPQSEVIPVSDCFPEPYFTGIQKSQNFAVVRRRNAAWIKKTAKWMAGEGYTEQAENLLKVITLLPNGTKPFWSRGGGENADLRQRLMEVVGRGSQEEWSSKHSSALWEIIEEYSPGEDPSMRMVVEENSHWIGEIPLPYDLGGKIPFSEAIFIDNLYGGVGDCTAGILRGLQELHSRNACLRTDLADTIARPYMITNDEELYEDAPSRLQRGKGFRLLLLNDGRTLSVLPEQAAMAAVQSSLGDETSLQRAWMGATGDNNMSMAANVDPQQSRTATGSRIAAFNQDILTKDLNDMFNMTSLKPDAEIMYELNRSELTEPLWFDAAPYNRNYSVEKDPYRESWQKAEPAMFQIDGEIVVKAGSTLADDDEIMQQRANGMWQNLRGAPNVNQDTLRDQYLIAMGEGKNLQKWAQPQQPPPPDPNKASTSLSIKGEDPSIPAAIKLAVLQSANVPIPPEAAQQWMAQGMPMDQPLVPAAEPPPSPGPVAAAGSAQPPPAAPPAAPMPIMGPPHEPSAYAAAKGMPQQI